VDNTAAKAISQSAAAQVGRIDPAAHSSALGVGDEFRDPPVDSAALKHNSQFSEQYKDTEQR
jgi:hypothetical protein